MNNTHNVKAMKELERISSMIFVCEGLSKVCELLAKYSASKDKKIKEDFERQARTFGKMAKICSKGLVKEVSTPRRRRKR